MHSSQETSTSSDHFGAGKQHRLTTLATVTLDDEVTARRYADQLAELLDAEGAVIAAHEASPGRWALALYFDQSPEKEALRALVASVTGEEAAQALAFDTVAPKDWIAASLAGLVPVRAGRFLVHGGHDRDKPTVNDLAIEIEAALAFGTGHHGTTRGCLVLLDDLLKREQPRRVLDLGTGTGVLAIAAAKRLKCRITASDIDPRAVMVARANARLNGVGPLIDAFTATGFTTPRMAMAAPFDLVLANILATPLRRLAQPLAQHLSPGGDVILSGLLPGQAMSVVDAYRAQGLVLRRRLDLDGWTSLWLRSSPRSIFPHSPPLD